VARIGALYIGTADAGSFKKELREGLRDEGQNIAFEFRSAEGKLDRLPWSLMPGLDREHRKQEKRHAG
jgi:hypothetical protein